MMTKTSVKRMRTSAAYKEAQRRWGVYGFAYAYIRGCGIREKGKEYEVGFYNLAKDLVVGRGGSFEEAFEDSDKPENQELAYKEWRVGPEGTYMNRDEYEAYMAKAKTRVLVCEKPFGCGWTGILAHAIRSRSCFGEYYCPVCYDKTPLKKASSTHGEPQDFGL